MKIKYSRIKLTLAVGIGAAIFCGVVVYAATSTILGIGNSVEPSEITDSPAIYTARRLTIPPGEVGAWHYHPGIITSAVGPRTPEDSGLTGSVTIEDGCGETQTYSPGQGFEQVGGRVHRAMNNSLTTVLEHNMFINNSEEDARLTVNIPNNERLCGPPKEVEECKYDGWRTFNFPNTFGNQGACIKYVHQRPRTSLLTPVRLTP